MQLAFGDGGNRDVGYIGHAGESLSPKPHGLDALQVFKRRQLGSRVSLAQYGEILVSDAVAVVGDLDEFEATVLDD